MNRSDQETRDWSAERASNATATGMLAASDLASGDIVANRYRIERILGMGAMGVVYQAFDQQLGIDVALKLLRPELAARADAFDRFRQELLLARQVSSPYVVRIHDLVQHGKVWLISMDFVAGQSLERLLESEGVLSVERALSITSDLAQGLAVAHDRGVVHRDLKPANVMIDASGRALVTDFGVARSMGATGLTASGMVVGTPAYLSPEQAQALPTDGRSDVYALGLMLYEMLTGKLPFSDGTPSEMLVQRIVRSAASVRVLDPGIPEWVARLVARMLDVRLSARFQSADEVVRAIATQRVPRPRRSPRTWLLLAMIPILGFALVLISWRWSQPEQPALAVVPAQQLDLAVLPFRNDSADPSLQALLDGLSQIISAELVSAPGADVSEFERARVALSRLNFDAATALRNRAQVAEALKARALLEGQLTAAPDGLKLSVQLIQPQAESPEWFHEVRAGDSEGLVAGLPDLLISLRKHLKLAPAAETMPAPDLGSVIALSGDGSDPLQPFPATASDTVRAMLWWRRLRFLEGIGDLAGAEMEAGQAQIDLVNRSGPETIRTRALAAIIRGQGDTVIDQLQELSRNQADHASRKLLARALADSGQFDAAAAALQHVVDEDDSDVDAWYAMGKYAYLRNDTRAAVENYLPRAWMLSTRLANKPLLADTENLLGLGYRSLGQPETAAQYFERAAALRKQLGNARGEAASLQNLAMVRATLGQIDDADAALTRARQLLEPLGDTAALADLENDIGVFEEERGAYRRALESYRKALALRQPLGDPRAIGESLLNVGFGYYQVGEFDNAQVHWERAQTVYAELEDPGGQVRARQSLGLALIARGAFTEAREALDTSLKVAESAQMAEERAVSLLSLADLSRLEGHYADAEKAAARAHELFEQREDSRGQVESRLVLAAIALDTGDDESTRAQLKLLASAAIENREQQAILSLRQGEWALAQGKLAAAQAYAQEAEARSVEAHSLATQLSARLLGIRILARDPKNRIAPEIERARQELSSYASVPLRLELASTSLDAGGAGTSHAYREARLLLGRIPSWGKATAIHLGAARALESSDPQEGALARQRAWDSFQALSRTSTPRQWRQLQARYKLQSNEPAGQP